MAFLLEANHCNHHMQDRISQLPEDILHNIMSHLQRPFGIEPLTLKPLVYFGVLSKAFHQAWLSYPHLSFSFRPYKGGWSRVSEIRNDMQLVNHVDCYLHECSLQLLDFAIPLPSVKRLSLYYIKTCTKTVECIIHGCPLLEHLEIVSCRDILPIDVSGISNLRHIYINSSNFYPVHRHERGLTQFSCNKVQMPCFYDVASLSSLRVLRLSGDGVVNDIILDRLLTQLSQLEYLSINNCCELENPKISSSSITSISISQSRTNVIRISCPKLERFSYKSTEVSYIQQENNCSRDWKLDLHFSFMLWHNDTSKDMFSKLRSLFFNIKIKAVTCLKVKYIYENWLFFDDGYLIKERIAQDEMSHPGSQSAKLEHLKLCLRSCKDIPFVILDLFLWACHPEFITMDIISLVVDDFGPVLQSIVQSIITRTTFKCGCRDGGELLHCWHHSLRDVQLVFCGYDEGSSFKRMELDGVSDQAIHKGLEYIRYRVCFNLMWK